MQYLQLFEQHALYAAIPDHVFAKYIHGPIDGRLVTDFYLEQWEDITDLEAQSIYAAAQQRFSNLSLECDLVNPNKTQRTEVFPRYLRIFAPKRLSLCVYKLQDEWYYLQALREGGSIRHYRQFYRCDQLAGLYACLQNLYRKS